MRAIVASATGGPEVLQLVEVATPEPQPGEILIKVCAAGVNRADLMQRQGFYPPPPGISEVIGLECSGVVAEVGDGVSGWALGDHCVALIAGGGYAEYVVAPAGQVTRPPADVDLVSAAGLIEVAATVHSNFDHGRLAEGETLLVHGGSGGIGSFAVQYAKACGVRVITTAGSAEKLSYCRDLGADLAVCYSDDWPKLIKEFTGDDGISMILDNMGAKYLSSHLDLLARGGRIVTIGFQGGRSGTIDLRQLMTKNATLTATSLRFRPVAEKAGITQAVSETIWPMISSGQIRPAPETRFPLAEAARAHAQLESGENLGKILLVADSELR